MVEVMMAEMFLIRDPEGSITLGIPSPIGLLPIVTFSSFEELRRFAMGILGYCEHLHPEIPSAFLKAFTDKEETNGN